MRRRLVWQEDSSRWTILVVQRYIFYVCHVQKVVLLLLTSATFCLLAIFYYYFFIWPLLPGFSISGPRFGDQKSNPTTISPTTQLSPETKNSRVFFLKDVNMDAKVPSWGLSWCVCPLFCLLSLSSICYSYISLRSSWCAATQHWPQSWSETLSWCSWMLKQ